MAEINWLSAVHWGLVPMFPWVYIPKHGRNHLATNCGRKFGLGVFSRFTYYNMVAINWLPNVDWISISFSFSSLTTSWRQSIGHTKNRLKFDLDVFSKFSYYNMAVVNWQPTGDWTLIRFSFSSLTTSWRLSVDHPVNWSLVLMFRLGLCTTSWRLSSDHSTVDWRLVPMFHPGLRTISWRQSAGQLLLIEVCSQCFVLVYMLQQRQ